MTARDPTGEPMLSQLLAYTDKVVVDPLIESLFALLLATPDRGLPERHRAVIAGPAGPAFGRALDALQPHKVFPLLSHQLERFHLLSGLPETARARLLTTHREVRAVNMMQLLSAAGILKAASQRGDR